MRTTPTKAELTRFEAFSEEDFFLYAVTRMIECEDVWSIGGDEGFAILEKGDQPYITIWPYQQFAQEYCTDEYAAKRPVSISLEMFVENLIPQCQDQGIAIEVFARPGKKGHWISAKDLDKILEQMMESGTYHMDG